MMIINVYLAVKINAVYIHNYNVKLIAVFNQTLIASEEHI